MKLVWKMFKNSFEINKGFGIENDDAAAMYFLNI